MVSRVFFHLVFSLLSVTTGGVRGGLGCYPLDSRPRADHTSGDRRGTSASREDTKKTTLIIKKSKTNPANEQELLRNCSPVSC